MYMRASLLALLISCGLYSPASAQVENPDYRIRAEFRDESGESVGNATVKVISRFMQVYYGGVTRQDEYRFQISLESSQYANRSFNVNVNDFLVGTLNTDSQGFLDVTYRSDFHAGDEPDFPLPAGFPDPIDVGHTASIFDASNGNLVLSGIFGEEFERGDSDHDGDVDDDDLDSWKNSYGQLAAGPANGDFTGDNRSGGRDFLEWQRHYTGAQGGGGGGGGGGSGSGSGKISAVPEPATLGLVGFAMIGFLCSRRSL